MRVDVGALISSRRLKPLMANDFLEFLLHVGRIAECYAEAIRYRSQLV